MNPTLILRPSVERLNLEFLRNHAKPMANRQTTARPPSRPLSYHRTFKLYLTNATNRLLFTFPTSRALSEISPKRFGNSSCPSQ